MKSQNLAGQDRNLLPGLRITSYPSTLMAYGKASERRYLDGLTAGERIRDLSENAFDEFRGRQLAPGPEATSDSDIAAWIRANTSSDFHPSCTCRMGNDGQAVVDEEMKVHGIADLRVVDASVMPTITSGNTNSPVIMIAEKASDMIREDAKAG